MPAKKGDFLIEGVIVQNQRGVTDTVISTKGIRMGTLNNDDRTTNGTPKSTKERILTYVMVISVILMFGLAIEYLPLGS